MKTAFSKGLLLLLVVAFSLHLCIPTFATEAGTYASKYLTTYRGDITSEGDGVIKISFSVVAKDEISKLGASKIVVEKKEGSSWTPVKTYTNTSYPEMSTTNDFSYGAYVLYDGEEGETYRAKITVFGNTDYRTFTTLAHKA